MTREGKNSIVLAVILGLAGGAWLANLGPDHSACSSILVAASNSSACSADSFRWYAAWGLIALAVILAIKGLIDYSKAPSASVRTCLTCGAVALSRGNFCGNCGRRLSSSKQTDIT